MSHPGLACAIPWERRNSCQQKDCMPKAMQTLIMITYKTSKKGGRDNNDNCFVLFLSFFGTVVKLWEPELRVDSELKIPLCSALHFTFW